MTTFSLGLLTGLQPTATPWWLSRLNEGQASTCACGKEICSISLNVARFVKMRAIQQFHEGQTVVTDYIRWFYSEHFGLVRHYLYWPECGFTGDSKLPGLLVPKVLRPPPPLSWWRYFTEALSFGVPKRPEIWPIICNTWNNKYNIVFNCMSTFFAGVRFLWASAPFEMKAACLCMIVWRCARWLRHSWREQQNFYDGQDSIAFCGHCSPQLLDDNMMVLGNAYEKKFHIPTACPRCSLFWRWAGWADARMRIGNSHYQFYGTYAALRLHRERDVHCPAVNQLDITNEYRFAHRFMQLHAGTIAKMENQTKLFYSLHTHSYCLSTQWMEVAGGDATTYKVAEAMDEQPPVEQISTIQRMRQLWQYLYDNARRFPQSTLISCNFEKCRRLITSRRAELVYNQTPHFRQVMLGVGTRQLDTQFMSPPEGIVMAPIASDTAQAVGPVVSSVTVHNTQDKPSVMAALEGRSSVKKSVFVNDDGEYPDLAYKPNSKAAFRLKKFWMKFNSVCLTNERIDQAYRDLYDDKEFEEITMSKFTKEDVKNIKEELEKVVTPMQIGTRKANGKLEAINKSGKPARLVVDNTLQLLAVNIMACGIFQHILFHHEHGVFHSMSIKERPRDDVLDEFSETMGDPWGHNKSNLPKKIDSCCWEIDQTGMELHERCSRQGVGLLSYTYNALMRINNRISHKINAQFTHLHEAKIVHDVETGMHLRFRIKSPDVPKQCWFTAKFPDMYLDSGWALTSGVNFINELSGTFSSIVENPEHLFAINYATKQFRLQENTFDWKFKSVPLYQSEVMTEKSVFDIYLRGVFEGDDGGGAASRCLADPRNGGPHGLIVREQEDLGYSAKLKVIVKGRVEIIGAHFPVNEGLVCKEVPWLPAVTRYVSKLGVQTHVNITQSSKAARFLSLACMFAGRNEPLQRGFERSAERVIDKYGSQVDFWDKEIKTDGYSEIDRAFGNGLHNTYTLKQLHDHYRRLNVKVLPSSDTQIRMLNMSVAEDVDSNRVTRDDFCKLLLFAESAESFVDDDEAHYSLLPDCLKIN